MSQAYREVQAQVNKLKAEGKIAQDFDIRQSFEILSKEVEFALSPRRKNDNSVSVYHNLRGRKKADKRYEQSEKGRARKMEWDKVQNYYKTDICVMCGKEKRIVSKGRCDSCRRKK